MVYGYARVSTKWQAREGNSLEAQEAALKANGAQIIYTDCFTGKRSNRPNLKLLLEQLHEGDTLMCTKLDRIARSLTGGSELVNLLINRGIKVHILNIGILDNTPSSKLIRNIFFAFAEFERELIIERTQEGKEIAKQNGDYREGRPKIYSEKQIDHALQLKQKYSYRQVEELTGICKSTLIKRRNKKLKTMGGLDECNSSNKGC